VSGSYPHEGFLLALLLLHCRGPTHGCNPTVSRGSQSHEHAYAARSGLESPNRDTAVQVGKALVAREKDIFKGSRSSPFESHLGSASMNPVMKNNTTHYPTTRIKGSVRRSVAPPRSLPISGLCVAAKFVSVDDVYVGC